MKESQFHENTSLSLSLSLPLAYARSLALLNLCQVIISMRAVSFPVNNSLWISLSHMHAAAGCAKYTRRKLRARDPNYRRVIAPLERETYLRRESRTRASVREIVNGYVRVHQRWVVRRLRTDRVKRTLRKWS